MTPSTFTLGHIPDEFRFSIHSSMTCGSYEAESRTYKLFYGKSGKRWLVANQPNEGDNVYVEGEKNSDGFGGRILTFKLMDGTTVGLKGPWHSNADTLFEDTEYNARDKHLTIGIVAKYVKPDYYKGDLFTSILHLDKEPVIGEYDRVQKIAQEFANKLKHEVRYAMKSTGGGSSGPVKPQ